MTNDEHGRPREDNPRTANGHDTAHAQDHYLPRCPDCAARPAAGHYTHAPTCPLNRAVNKAIDKDRRWFAKRPGATVRRRPVTPAEQIDTELTSGMRPTGDVVVTQLRPGLRTRLFNEGSSDE